MFTLSINSEVELAIHFERSNFLDLVNRDSKGRRVIHVHYGSIRVN